MHLSTIQTINYLKQSGSTTFILMAAIPDIPISRIDTYFCPIKWRHSVCISYKILFLLWKLIPELKKLADDQHSSITTQKAVPCIYHIKHISIQPFATRVDWPEIGFKHFCSWQLYNRYTNLNTYFRINQCG